MRNNCSDVHHNQLHLSVRTTTTICCNIANRSDVYGKFDLMKIFKSDSILIAESWWLERLQFHLEGNGTLVVALVKIL